MMWVDQNGNDDWDLITDDEAFGLAELSDADMERLAMASAEQEKQAITKQILNAAGIDADNPVVENAIADAKFPVSGSSVSGSLAEYNSRIKPGRMAEALYLLKGTPGLTVENVDEDLIGVMLESPEAMEAFWGATNPGMSSDGWRNVTKRKLPWVKEVGNTSDGGIYVDFRLNDLSDWYDKTSNRIAVGPAVADAQTAKKEIVDVVNKGGTNMGIWGIDPTADINNKGMMPKEDMLRKNPRSDFDIDPRVAQDIFLKGQSDPIKTAIAEEVAQATAAKEIAEAAVEENLLKRALAGAKGYAWTNFKEGKPGFGAGAGTLGLTGAGLLALNAAQDKGLLENIINTGAGLAAAGAVGGMLPMKVAPTLLGSGAVALAGLAGNVGAGLITGLFGGDRKEQQLLNQAMMYANQGVPMNQQMGYQQTYYS